MHTLVPIVQMPESTAEGEAVAQWLEKRPTAVQWEVLPPALRARLGSEAAWLRALRAHSLGLQLPWSSALGVEEKEYLAELLKASRERLLLYPYHLARRLAACWPAETPFRYYREMLFEMLRSERSYDTIPNFTAADAARLLRVGRNEFLHALNECRSKGWLWKRRRGLIMKQLPSAPPPDLPLEDWWVVCASEPALSIAADLLAGRAPRRTRGRSGTGLGGTGLGGSGGELGGDDEADGGGAAGDLGDGQLGTAARDALVALSAARDGRVLAAALPEEGVRFDVERERDSEPRRCHHSPSARPRGACMESRGDQQDGSLSLPGAGALRERTRAARGARHASAAAPPLVDEAVCGRRWRWRRRTSWRCLRWSGS